MKNSILAFLIVLIFFGCGNLRETSEPSADEQFSFVFMTDIHVTPERNATAGLLQAIDTINKLSPDFVLTGGDNIMDALGQNEETSSSLYKLYSETMEKLKMPVFNTMGNHEVFGLYVESGVDSTHKEYGKKMYENRLEKRYYSFDHKHWHFIVLDGIGFTKDRHYYGYVDNEQLNWLKKDLENIGKEVPVAVSIHIPVLSAGQQVMKGPTEAFSQGTIITNATEVRELLEQYNVKLVLQGHLHFLEDISYNGIHYITGGAVSANWWQGPRYGMEEGFVKIDVEGENFNWKYVDFGWQVNTQK